MLDIKGIITHEEELFGCQVTTVDVQTKQAAKQIGRKIGQYVTVQTPVALNKDIKIVEVGECLAVVLDRALQPYYQDKLCICGIGHWSVPADALGPQTIHALPLKMFSEVNLQGNFREVCAFSPGTAMSNNIKTEVIVGGVVQTIRADCVLLVDSLVAYDTSTLFQTIQLSTAGGLNPHWAGRTADWSHLGVPVISLGVPVTIPLSALSAGAEEDDIMLTDIHIQEVITIASTIIAYAILRVGWPSLPQEACLVLAKSYWDPIPYSAIFDDDAL